MTIRTLTTLESFKLLDNLQAVSRNINDACDRLGLAPVTDFKEAFAAVEPIIRDVTGVIVKLQEQVRQFKPIESGEFLPTMPKYQNKEGSFDLSDDEWKIADQWAGVYETYPGLYEGMMVL